ncbi:MAG TPA: hypothetical protein VI837_03695 [Blastocatellia bacterium]|nr:hypothetical protein [Blastocatellia bacterium]
MRYKRGAPRAVWSCLVVFLSLCIPIFGQAARADNKSSSVRDAEDQPLIVCRVTLVMIDIDVRDGYLWPVSDLTHKDFSVFEDGKEQPIVFFGQKNVPNTGDSQGQYEIGYYPPSRDGEFKKVRVRFRAAKEAKDKGLRLTYYPKGYYATFSD